MSMDKIAQALPSLARFLPSKSEGGQDRAPQFSPAPPRVNLLPPAARIRANARRGRKVGAAVAGLSAATVAVIYALGFVTTMELQDMVDDLNSRKDALAQDLAVYAPVTNVAAQTHSLTDTIASQTAREVLHGEVLDEFVTAARQVGEVRSVSLNSGDGTGACQSVDPFHQRSLVACLTFTVAARAGQADAARLISALSANPIFVDAFIPTVSAADGETTLTGTVGITEDALRMTPSTDGLAKDRRDRDGTQAEGDAPAGDPVSDDEHESSPSTDTEGGQ